MQLTANQISGLLQKRAESNQHIYFDEVTDYGRHIAGHQSRIDAIAIKIGYSKYQIYGYEIKVNRQDFVHDEKWHNYLNMCNNLYFVCPHGLIGKDEVPAEAGLMYVTQNGRMVRIVKKAPYRTVEYSPKYFLGMIFNKCGLHFEGQGREARLERALQLEQKKADAKELGAALGSKLALDMLRQRNVQEDLERRIKRLEEVERYLKEKGIHVDGRERSYGPSPAERLKRLEAQELSHTSLDLLANDVERTCRNLESFMDHLRRRSEKILSQVKEDDDEQTC